MDPLSEVLSLLKLKSYVSGTFDVEAGSGFAIAKYDGVKCYTPVSGRVLANVGHVREIPSRSKPVTASSCLGDCPSRLPPLDPARAPTSADSRRSNQVKAAAPKVRLRLR